MRRLGTRLALATAVILQAFGSVIDAYKAFDTRQPGWIKVELKLAA